MMELIRDYPVPPGRKPIPTPAEVDQRERERREKKIALESQNPDVIIPPAPHLEPLAPIDKEGVIPQIH